MYAMFCNCKQLTTIYASNNFDVSNVTNYYYMFSNCLNLVGGNGTVYNRNYTNKEYAHIDEGESNPGYFTDYRVKEATIYYNSNNTLGELTVNSIKVRCTVEEGDSCNITVPSEVINSVGKYNSVYAGVTNSLTNLNNTITISKTTTLYAFYQSDVTNYYYDKTDYKTRILYRSEFFTSNNEMNSVLSLNKNGIGNVSLESGPGSSEWIGFSINQDTELEYNSISAAANSFNNVLYSVYRFNVTFEKGSNVDEIGSTISNCDVTSDNKSCSIVLPTITANPDYSIAGWNKEIDSKTGSSPLTIYLVSENNLVLYANAFQAYLMQGSYGNQTTNYLRTNIAKQDIETITFVNSLSSHTVNETDCFDVSLDEDKSVLAWVSDNDNNGKYEITIGANGKVYASTGEDLFNFLTNITSINDLQYLDTSNVTNMNGMFSNCNRLTSLDVSSFDTSKVTNMSWMFGISPTFPGSYISKLTTITGLNKFNTSKVTKMGGMFRGLTNLTSIDVSSFDTSKVTDMSGMFYHCISLTTLDLSNFDTSQVTDMSWMFAGDKYIYGATNDYVMSLNSIVGIENFDTSKVTDMYGMFQCNSFRTLNLSSWDTSKVTNMSLMFRGNNLLTTISISNDFQTTNVTNSTSMFLDCTSLVGGEGTIYDSSHIDVAYAHIDGGSSNPGYFSTR